jgi:hypothetical protein
MTMNNPMQMQCADDRRLVWVGYPEIADPDRFGVPDEAAGVLYLYVPLDVACRWLANGPTDDRVLQIRFHRTDEDDARLARARERYAKQAARSLDLWDHTPKGRYA